jgi:hypothetical protein
MKPKTHWIAEKIHTFFGESVTSVAHQTRFVRRTSHLDGLSFLKALVFGFIEKPRASLNELAQVCFDLGVEITPQGLDERINAYSVAFLKTIFARAIEMFQNSLSLPLPILQQFSAIRIVDSSVKELPDSLMHEYPGCGGVTGLASIKIQLVFEFLRGNLEQVILQAGRAADQGFQDYLELVRAGSLTIADLGYFKLDAFKAILEKGAYFLTRYLHPTALFTPSGERIDLLNLLRSAPDGKIDMSVLAGSGEQHRISCRLIAFRISQAVADRRRAIARYKAKGKGRIPKQQYLEILGWTIFLTNASEQMLSSEQVTLLYRVRWQIELVFKLWKSYAGMNQIAKWRGERVLTELFAKMIGIVLTHFLIAPLRMPEGAWSNHEISAVQVRKIFARSARQMNQIVANSHDLVLLLNDMLRQILRFGFKQKRRKKPNVCHALALVSLVFDIQSQNAHLLAENIVS